uniref:Uncharacterized protein n=1 Tax=Neospora caninum (strain Liverpool) TaxID=572307 RepID=A0A0F7UID7_NEOCL|nr:TPA: hypothetical protein BN1204_045172 [Neospora caninum Liverpool]
MAEGEESKELQAADPPSTGEREAPSTEKGPFFFCKIVASPDLETPRGLSALDDLLGSTPERLELLSHLSRHSRQKAARSHQAPHAIYGPGLLSNCLPHQRRGFTCHQPLPPLTLLPEPYRYQTFSLKQLLGTDTHAASSPPADQNGESPGAQKEPATSTVFAELAGASGKNGSEAKKVAASLAAFLVAGQPASAVAPHRLRQVDRPPSRAASHVSVSRASESALGASAFAAQPPHAEGSAQSSVVSSYLARSLSAGGAPRLSAGPGVGTPAAFPAACPNGYPAGRGAAGAAQAGPYVHPGVRGAFPRPGMPAANVFPPVQSAASSGVRRPTERAPGEDGRSSVLAQRFASAAVRRAGSAVGSACSGAHGVPPVGSACSSAHGGVEGRSEAKEKKRRREEKKGKKEKRKRRTEGE